MQPPVSGNCTITYDSLLLIRSFAIAVVLSIIAYKKTNLSLCLRCKVTQLFFTVQAQFAFLNAYYHIFSKFPPLFHDNFLNAVPDAFALRSSLNDPNVSKISDNAIVALRN